MTLPTMPITVTLGADAPFTTTLSAFLADNAGAFDDEVPALRAALDAGDVWVGGGGAAPLVTIERAA